MQSTDPMEIDDPIRDMIEDDVRHVPSLALDRPRVLNAICKVMGIHLTTHLTTSHYTRGEDSWTATPRDAPAFTGTLTQVVAYVRGYAAAWLSGRDRQRALVNSTHRHMLDQLEKVR